MFAEFIKKRREKWGNTQKQIAKLLGVSPTAVNSWEMGKSRPRLEHHLKIAKFFGMTQVELTEMLNSPVIIAEATKSPVPIKERTVRIVRAANDFDKTTNINRAVCELVKEMEKRGWTVVSAQTAMGMYYNVTGVSVRSVEWCTTLVFER